MRSLLYFARIRLWFCRSSNRFLTSDCCVNVAKSLVRFNARNTEYKICGFQMIFFCKCCTVFQKEVFLSVRKLTNIYKKLAVKPQPLKIRAFVTVICVNDIEIRKWFSNVDSQTSGNDSRSNKATELLYRCECERRVATIKREN